MAAVSILHVFSGNNIDVSIRCYNAWRKPLRVRDTIFIPGNMRPEESKLIGKALNAPDSGSVALVCADLSVEIVSFLKKLLNVQMHVLYVSTVEAMGREFEQASIDKYLRLGDLAASSLEAHFLKVPQETDDSIYFEHIGQFEDNRFLLDQHIPCTWMLRLKKLWEESGIIDSSCRTISERV